MTAALILSIILNIVLFIIVINGRHAYHLIMKKTLAKEKTKDDFTKPIEYSSLQTNNEQEQALLEALKSALEKDKIFLDSDLDMSKLARTLGTNKTTLSHIINNSLHQNFATLINKYRVREAIDLLSNKQNNNLKIEHVGEMCGFNNRQAFHAAFKKIMGITPTHFRKIPQKDIDIH